MHILNNQEIFDAALSRMMTDSDKHLVTPEKRPPEAPPEPPIIHQPVLVKAPSQSVTADGAYITHLEYRMDSQRSRMVDHHQGGRAIVWCHGQPECTVSMELLLLGHPNHFLAAASAGKIVRLVFSE